MADTTILLNGFSILNDTNVTISTKGGYQNEGGVTITGGELLFEADDIILMEVSGADENDGVSSDSEITRIIVYDNAYDYYNDIIKYDYSGSNPNQNATIRGNTSGVGDNYLRINANVMTSDDPNAPDIDTLFVVAGTDLTDVANGGTMVIDQFEDYDYNDNDTIDGDGYEPADGIFTGGDTGNNIRVVLCYVRGTLIETPDGPRFIETLREGDLVNTLDDGPQPIRWAGSNRCDATGDMAPICIRRGTLGNIRDLWVSPNHRMLIRGARAELLFGQSEVLAAAKHLVDGDAIRAVPRMQVDYFHFLFDRHQIVFAEGCASESLFPGKQSLQSVDDAARAEIVALFPELEGRDCLGDLSRYELRRFEAEAWRKAG